MDGSLRRVRYARPGKLFTAHPSLLRAEVAILRSEVPRELSGRVIALLQQSQL